MEEVPTPSFHWWNSSYGNRLFIFLVIKIVQGLITMLLRKHTVKMLLEMLGEGVSKCGMLNRFSTDLAHLADEYGWK